LRNSIKTKINDSEELSTEYFGAVEKTIHEINQLKNHSLSQKELYKKKKIITNKYKNSLKDETWKMVFNGRNILKKFVGNLQGIRYELFRNLIIAKMKNDNYQPEGMKKIIDEILSIE